MLELKDVKKSYHSQTILHKTNLQLKNGIYWIKGANGSGKTTLFKMIAGILPFHGDIAFNHISQKKNPVDYRRCVGWAEAEPVYPDFISGRDLICFYSDVRNVEAKEGEELLSLFQLTKYINDPIGAYSAGMTKKLSLLLALIGNPSLCILDEPLITLDSESLGIITSLIIELHKNKRTMFLISSHQDISPQFKRTCTEILINNQNISLIE